MTNRLYNLSVRFMGEVVTNLIVIAALLTFAGVVVWFLAERMVERDDREFKSRFCAEAVKRGLLKECR
jgi:hypothetical protein